MAHSLLASPHWPPDIAGSFAKQITWSHDLGSPFTSGILKILAEDGAAGGLTAQLLVDWPGDPIADAVPLRLAGALHALVLQNAMPRLSACYPPHEAVNPDALARSVLETLASHQDFIRRFLTSPPQTNEVGRSAVLVGGFHAVARWSGLPLRCLEIGASAGLNTIWDRFRYRLGSLTWGAEGSPVDLRPEWHGPSPSLCPDLHVAERAACDMAPVALDDEEARLRLRAYIWPDQRERLTRLEAAMGMARRDSVHVEQADAAVWIPAQLARASEGMATVLYHSIMWQYLPAETQSRIDDAIHAAGARSTKKAPLAWLRFETTGPDTEPALDVTLWPSGRHLRLATTRAHGNAVAWLGEEPDGVD